MAAENGGGFDKIYCYSNSNVLKNKKGILIQSELYDYERERSYIRLVDLDKKPIMGNLDYDHLKRIHKAIFQDVYDWAGKERVVDIAKSNLFCRVMFISDMAEEIFQKYAKENYLLGRSKTEVVERLSYYIGMINALHPFREGNGRSQREFIRCAAAVAGYEMDWTDVGLDQMVKASIESFRGNNAELKKIFEQGLSQMSYKNQLLAAKSIAKKKGPLGIACNNYFNNINRISADLENNHYIAREETIRSIEHLERVAGCQIEVKSLSLLLKVEGDIGIAAKQVSKSLSRLPSKINVPER